MSLHFLRATGISRSFGAHQVLTDISLTIQAQTRAGLIGQNGSGKSTLMRILAGVDQPDTGVVETSPGAQVGLLWQDFPLPAEAPVHTAAELAQRPLLDLRGRLESLAVDLAAHPDNPELLTAYGQTLEQADRLEAWTLEATRDQTLAGLGLGEVDPARTVGTLSGGQRSRLALACLLLSRPDVLLLDEPTNHLDEAATTFLAGTVRDWPGPVLVASHDRAFLEESATEILDLDPDPSGAGGLTRTRGGFSDYILARLDQRAAWERQYQLEQAELRRLRGRVRQDHQVGHPGAKPRTEGGSAKKFYADRNARVVKRRVDDTSRRLIELSEQQVRKPPRELAFAGLTHGGAPQPGRVLLRDAQVTGRLAPVSLDLSPGEQLLLVGPNGSGKSTLLAVLAGQVPLTGGQVQVSGSFGLLGQEPAPVPDLTVEQIYRRAVGEAAPALTEFGLLAPRELNRPGRHLSTGQVRRLELATILARPPAILALDEPTNHLSLDLVTLLEELLPTYPGIAVLTSHDRWLRRRWAGPQLELVPAVR